MRRAQASRRASCGAGSAAPGPPDRSKWHAEPVKVFDNLYFVGQTEYSAWAVTTSQGIIIVDTIWDYSVEDEIVGGLKKLGLDPKNIKYAIVSHGHIDHAGGAKYLQDHFGTHIIAALLPRTGVCWLAITRPVAGFKPQRDMVATDGEKLTLGDTTLTLYLTPGHTLRNDLHNHSSEGSAERRTSSIAEWGRHGIQLDSEPQGAISLLIGRTASGFKSTPSPRSVSGPSPPGPERTQSSRITRFTTDRSRSFPKC